MSKHSPATTTPATLPELHPRSALVLIDRARSGFHTSGLTSSTERRLLAHLHRLAALAEHVRLHQGRLGSSLKTAGRAFGLDIAPTDSTLPTHRTHIVFEGQVLNTTAHVKVSDATHPDRCARIYFARTADHRIIVSHLGRHL